MPTNNSNKVAFISYSRGDSLSFVIRLYKFLEEQGLSTWFDYVNIETGENYLRHIQNGILNANNFIFVLSPGAVASEYCMNEMWFAQQHGKRIIPVYHIDGNYTSLPEALAMPDWLAAKQTEHVAFNRNELQAIVTNLGIKHKTVIDKVAESLAFDVDNIEVAFAELKKVLIKDSSYTAWHTKAELKALDWDEAGRPVHKLLIARDKISSEARIKEANERDFPPYVTDLQAEFICESKKNGEGMLTDVFLSYAREDIEAAQSISFALQRKLITTWVDYADLEEAEAYADNIREGIEGATNFVYLISPKSVISAYCIKELDYAISLRKRIVPVLIANTVDAKLPEQIRHAQYIKLTDNYRDVRQIVRLLDTKNDFLHWHKIYLVQALKWDRQKQNEAILLRGLRLERALEWLETTKHESVYSPTTLQKTFIQESDAKKGQLGSDVFISYSRTDGDFARLINENLQLSGHTTWFDQESLAAGSANFWQEITEGIRNSNNIVFVISPEAVKSEYCKKEVDFALAEGKRIITLNYRSAELDDLQTAGLASIQWIDFNDKKDYTSPLGELTRALNTDKEHVNAHTRWNTRAREWDLAKHDPDLLLKGNELALAKDWLNRAEEENKIPSPNALQNKFILESDLASKAFELKEKKAHKRMRMLLVFSIIGLALTVISSAWVFYVKTKNKARDKDLFVKILSVANASSMRDTEHMKNVESPNDYCEYFISASERDFNEMDYEASKLDHKFAEITLDFLSGTYEVYNLKTRVNGVKKEWDTIISHKRMCLNALTLNQYQIADSLRHKLIEYNTPEEEYLDSVFRKNLVVNNKRLLQNPDTGWYYLFPERHNPAAYKFTSNKPISITDTIRFIDSNSENTKFEITKGEILFPKSNSNGLSIRNTLIGFNMYPQSAVSNLPKQFKNWQVTKTLGDTIIIDKWSFTNKPVLSFVLVNDSIKLGYFDNAIHKTAITLVTAREQSAFNFKENALTFTTLPGKDKQLTGKFTITEDTVSGDANPILGAQQNKYQQSISTFEYTKSKISFVGAGKVTNVQAMTYATMKELKNQLNLKKVNSIIATYSNTKYVWHPKDIMFIAANAEINVSGELKSGNLDKNYPSIQALAFDRRGVIERIYFRIEDTAYAVLLSTRNRSTKIFIFEPKKLEKNQQSEQTHLMDAADIKFITTYCLNK